MCGPYKCTVKLAYKIRHSFCSISLKISECNIIWTQKSIYGYKFALKKEFSCCKHYFICLGTINPIILGETDFSIFRVGKSKFGAIIILIFCLGDKTLPENSSTVSFFFFFFFIFFFI